MKKVLFFISILGLAGCSSYTVQNNYGEKIKVGDVVVEANQCAAEWGEGFFGLFGDFPVAITKEDENKLHDENAEEYEAAHYVVNANGKVEKAEEACEVPDEPAGDTGTAGEETGGEEPAGEEPAGEEPAGEEPAGEEPAGGAEATSPEEVNPGGADHADATSPENNPS